MHAVASRQHDDGALAGLRGCQRLSQRGEIAAALAVDHDSRLLEEHIRPARQPRELSLRRRSPSSISKQSLSFCVESQRLQQRLVSLRELCARLAQSLEHARWLFAPEQRPSETHVPLEPRGPGCDRCASVLLGGAELLQLRVRAGPVAQQHMQVLARQRRGALLPARDNVQQCGVLAHGLVEQAALELVVGRQTRLLEQGQHLLFGSLSALDQRSNPEHCVRAFGFGLHLASAPKRLKHSQRPPCFAHLRSQPAQVSTGGQGQPNLMTLVGHLAARSRKQCGAAARTFLPSGGAIARKRSKASALSDESNAAIDLNATPL
eukprot:3726581-Rhodomonas_salina.1